MKFAIACVVLVACGGDDAPSIDDFGTRVVEVECKVAAECGEAVDEASCKASATLDDMAFINIVADVKAGIIIYDADKLDACLAAFDDGCKPPTIHVAADDPCANYLTGTVATGGACFFSGECADHASCKQTVSSCDSNTACCAGTCAAPAAALPAIGAACTSNIGCAGDAYCKTTTTGSTDGMCAALIATEGAACDDIFACADPMVCTGFGGGTCYKPAAHGATCNPDLSLLDWECIDERDYCDPDTTKCTARLAIGATCQEEECTQTAACFNGTCVGDVGVGAACNSSTGPNCAFGLECTNNVCAKEPSGMACR